MKRLLNCTATDFKKMDKHDLLRSIKASEGRVMMAETVCTSSPLYPGLTNAEYATAFGADIVLLNMFDVNDPHIEGLENIEQADVIRTLKEWIGRPVGINLEPVDPNAEKLETLTSLSTGRMATKESLEKAKRLGVDYVCLTGNPQTGVSNQAITQSIAYAKEVGGDDFIIIAGKMHGAGVKTDTPEGLANRESIKSFIQAGADIVLIPGVGTVPGTTLEKTERLIQLIHEADALALTTIGTSQEGADKATIEQMALFNKMAGADIHHIGDAGLHGIACPENIMNYSIAIRGKRHTYIRMAQSIMR